MRSSPMKGYMVIAVAGIFMFSGLAATAAPTDKVDICHKPGERNQRIVSINLEKDGPKHFGHGDYLVDTLPNCDTIPDNDCDGIPDDTADGDDLCVAETGAEGATCNTDAGLCVTPEPETCLCADYFAGGNRVGLDFPADVFQFFSGPRTDCASDYRLEYLAGDGDPTNFSNNLLQFYISSTNTIQCYADVDPSGQIRDFPSADPTADMQACIRYVEETVEVTNGCLSQ